MLSLHRKLKINNVISEMLTNKEKLCVIQQVETQIRGRSRQKDWLRLCKLNNKNVQKGIFLLGGILAF